MAQNKSVNRTRGRVWAKRLQPVLLAFSSVLRILPGAVLDCIWTWSDLLPQWSGLALRYAIVRARAASCGTNVFIGQDVYICGWKQLQIGNNVSIHRTCYIDANGGITIGDNVSIAHQSTIIATNHAWDNPNIPIKDNPTIEAPVTIADDVWIAAGCRVLAGVTIGRRVVVAAGAVVTKNIPTGVIVGGVPAQVFKMLDSK